MKKTIVQRAYLFAGDEVRRVISDSHGRVLTAMGRFVEPHGNVVKVPGAFERWVDVPAAWLGFQPYWR